MILVELDKRMSLVIQHTKIGLSVGTFDEKDYPHPAIFDEFNGFGVFYALRSVAIYLDDLVSNLTTCQIKLCLAVSTTFFSQFLVSSFI